MQLPAFAEIQATTYCPYAATARVRYGPSCDDGLSAERNLDAVAADMAVWAETAFSERSHGYVMELRDPRAGDFDAVRSLLRGVLIGLNERDPAGSACMATEIEAPAWQFEFAGVRMFANVFASCYPKGHTKHVRTDGVVYLFFQPEFAFDFCGVTPANRLAKERIRKRFADAGKPYSGELIDGRIEAHLYMFPLALGDPPVRWW